MAEDKNLLLSDLTIKGYRGIEELTIPRLGRVTLLAGKNSIGKTTVLEAVRIYAARGRPSELRDVLETREEYISEFNSEGNKIYSPDWNSLFNGREAFTGTRATIGQGSNFNQLIIQVEVSGDDRLVDDPDIFADEPAQMIKVIFEGSNILEWAISYRDRKFRWLNEIRPPRIKCRSIGPGLLGGLELADLWDNIVLEPYEDRAIYALNMIEDYKIDRITMIGENRPSLGQRSSSFYRGVARGAGRRPVVKLQGHEHRVPLKSLGDGAMRIFSMALSLAASSGGILLVDEVENGIHHSIQIDFWRMVLQTAHENNVQVIATTHSWDCIKYFAQAIRESPEVDAKLVRLTRRHGPLSAVEYSEDDLIIATEYGTEVR